MADQSDASPAIDNQQTRLDSFQSLFRTRVSSLFDVVKEKVDIYFRGHVRKPPRPKANDYAEVFNTDFFSASNKNFQSHRDKIEAGTCDWIRSTGQYQQWFHSKNYQLLWFTGNAGMGKSTLMAYIVSTVGESSEDLAILCCFCDDVITQSVSSMISAAIYQLIRESDVLRGLAMSKDGTCELENGRLGQKGQSRNPEDLWDLLCDVVQESHLKRVYLVVDGLDDCLPEVQRALMKLFNHGPEKLSVLVASQPLEDLHLALWNDHQRLKQDSKMQNLDASYYDTQINADIQRFLEKNVVIVGDKRDWTAEEKSKVLHHLSTQRAGVFLPFVLCLEDFEHTDTKNVTENLKDLFNNLTNLDKTYEKLIRSISKKLQERPSDVLKWVIYARRPMQVEELAFACFNDTKAESTRALRGDLRLFGPILRVKHVKNALDDPEDTVDFIHPSARRFLVEQTLRRDSSADRFIVQPHRAHSDLAVSCLSKLQSCSRDNYPAWYDDNRAKRLLTITQRRIFLSYALHHWYYHVNMALRDEETDAATTVKVRRLLREISLVFSEPGRKNFALLLGIRNDDYVFANEISDVSILEFYASLGSSVMVNEWLEHNKQQLAQYQEPWGVLESALHVATYIGHLQTTISLIECCRHDQFQEKKWLQYVRMAGQSGNERLLHKLLAMSGRSPILLAGAAIAACLSSKLDVLDVLTEDFKILTIRDAWGMSVLHRLATCPTGNSLFTRDALTKAFRYFIVDKGLDPNIPDSFGNTIMHHICWDISKCYKDLIESVSGMGASLELSNNLGCRPLHLAVCRGPPDVLDYFVDQLGNEVVQTTSNGGLTPLHWAMDRGFADWSFEDSFIIIRQLLLRGARLDAVTKRSGRSPISVACENPFMRDVLSLVFYRLDGIDNMHQSLLQFMGVWIVAKTIEDIWFGLSLPERLPPDLLEVSREENESAITNLIIRFKILNRLHPRLLMLHLRDKYIPYDEVEHVQAQSSMLNEKPDRSSPEISQSTLLYNIMALVLEENDSGDENHSDSPDVQSVTSNDNDDAPGHDHAASRATPAESSNSTQVRAVSKYLETGSIWFMIHLIFDNVCVEDGELALAQVLLKLRARLFYRASGQLTGMSQANDHSKNHGSATQNGGKHDGDGQRHSTHNANDDKDDLQSAQSQTAGPQSTDTGPETFQKSLDDFNEAVKWWTAFYKFYFCADSSETIAQEQHKPIYQIDKQFYDSVLRVSESTESMEDHGHDTETKSGSAGVDTDQEGMPSVNVMTTSQASFPSAHSAQTIEVWRVRRILRRPEEIFTRIRKKLGGKHERSP